ncbi:MAG: MlaE family ABC transporter permease [Phycisphaeraceae bacterium]
MLHRLSTVGGTILDQLEGFGRFSLFAGSAAAWACTGPKSFGRLRLLLPQLYIIGTRSIPVVMLVGAFVGAVLGIEMFAQFASISQESRLGGIINVSVVRQIGPVLAAVMIAGRVGGAVAAELGTMRVTEQIDALRVMGTDPIAYLVVPRVIACILMLPILTVFSDVLGVVGGWIVVVQAYGVNSTDYWRFSADFINNWDLFTGLLKSIFFGYFIGIISCYRGFHAEGGSQGVGQAATSAFVTSFIVIIVSNFFVAKFLNDLYRMIYGPSQSAFG